MSDEETVCMFELIVGFFFIFSLAGKLDKSEFMFFLTGGVILQNEKPNPDPSWLTKMMWSKICRLDSQPAFSGEIDKCAYVEKLWGHVTEVKEPILIVRPDNGPRGPKHVALYVL
jgi:hypothetical protein